MPALYFEVAAAGVVWVMPTTMIDTDPQLLALLETLIAEVRGLRSDLARDRWPPRVLSRVDCDRLSRLLPAIAGALGSDSFASRDLLTHESAAVRLVVHDFTAKKLGRLLLRAEGVPIDGLRVQRAGVELGVVLWKIAAC